MEKLAKLSLNYHHTFYMYSCSTLYIERTTLILTYFDMDLVKYGNLLLSYQYQNGIICNLVVKTGLQFNSEKGII